MKKREEKEANNERWLLTYSDLITLLMIFFVVLYAGSNINASKYKALSDSFKVALGGGKSIIGNDNSPDISENTPPINTKVSEEKSFENLKKSVDNYIENSNLKFNVSTAIEERGLVISLKDSLIFDSGKANIKPESKVKLVELGRILSGMDNYMRVEGHTDNIPINNNEFKSNWQLSVIRATNVTEMLIDKCNISPKRLSAVGYGEYRPIGDNKTEQGRSKNRRVDLIILSSKFDKVESNK